MVQTPLSTPNLYPDSDGKPMADNTEQYRWIAKLVTNLKHLLREQTAFVAGDLLWYPLEVPKGEKTPSQAPDVMVVLGRPDGARGSYQQWRENNIAPQVVFEILSPSNTASEMVTKQAFYAQYGTLEMYFYDPKSEEFWGLTRPSQVDELQPVMALNLPWVSPLLQIRFEHTEAGLGVYYPDGKPFQEPEAFALAAEQVRTERDQAQAERDQAQAERDQAQAERDQAQAERDRLAAKLRALGIDPNNL
ncbi:MAG: Uma2 family endonuclease [Spirulina sp. SIO3F2]|nr:Uma2 family endonuclease [Spirulina sp. SIO3F2]